MVISNSSPLIHLTRLGKINKLFKLVKYINIPKAVFDEVVVKGKLKEYSEAFIIESIVASILISLFSVGFIVLYHASKYVYNKKFADWLLVIGILMIVISFALLQYLLLCKTTEPGEVVCP